MQAGAGCYEAIGLYHRNRLCSRPGSAGIRGLAAEVSPSDWSTPGSCRAWAGPGPAAGCQAETSVGEGVENPAPLSPGTAFASAVICDLANLFLGDDPSHVEPD